MCSSPVILEDPLIKISLTTIGVIRILVSIVHNHIRLLLANHLDWILLLHHHILREVLVRRIIAELVAGISVWRIAWVASFSLFCHLVSSVSQFLLTLNCRPIYTVTYRFSTSAKDWKWIEPRICSKDLFPVLSSSYIVCALKWLSKLI